MAPQGGPSSQSADQPFGAGARQALPASAQHQQGAYGQQHGQTQPLTSGTIQQMYQRGYSELRPEDVAQLQAAFGDNWPALAGAYLGLGGSSQVPPATGQQRSPASNYQQGPMPPLPPAVDVGRPQGGVMPPLPPPEESAPEGYNPAGGHQHMAGMHVQGHPGMDFLAPTGARPEAEHDAAAAAAAEVGGGVYDMPEQVAAAHLVAQMQQGGSPGDRAGGHARMLGEAPLDTKRCTSCKDFKPRDQFNKDKTRGDGLACTCRPCANRNTKNWHHKHRQQNKAKSELRKALPDSAHCTHCKMVKASTEFYGDRSQSNGLKPHCKVCEREVKRDRRQRKAAVEALSLGQAGVVVKRQKLRHATEGLQAAAADLEGQQAAEAQAQAIGTEWAAGQQMDPQLLQQMIQQHAQGQPQLQDPNMHLSAPCGHQLQIAQ